MTVDDGMVVEDDMSFEVAFGESTGAPVEVEPVIETTSEEPVEKTVDEVVEEATVEPVVEAPAPAVQQRDDSRYQALEAEIAALKQPKPVEQTTVEPESVLSKEDAEFLTGFKEEWPDAQKALDLQRKVLEQEMEARVQAAVKTAVETMQTTMAPLVKNAQESAQEKFVREITGVHSDAVAVLPEVEKWVNTLPPGMSKAYNNILDNGTSSDVVELFNTYKKLTGKTTPVQPVAPVVDKDKEAKLQKMQGVRTERTGVSAEADPYDFESAFAQATKTR